MNLRAIAVVGCLLFSGEVFAQDVSPRAREVVQTIRELRTIGIPDVGENNIPASIPPLLRRLNHQLMELITDVLNSKQPGLPPEIELGERVLAQLKAAGWEEISPHRWNAYGELVDIEVRGREQSDLLTAATKLWIPCGPNPSDPESSLYVYKRNGKRWLLVLAAEADYDPQGREEQSGLQYGISDPDEEGRWFLAVAHAPPSCRSSQRRVGLKILRVGPSADKPTIIYTGHQDVHWSFNPPFDLGVGANWFALTWGAQRRLDGGLGVFISRFEVTGDRVERIPPLALTPEDFLDAWLQLPWDQAKQWAGQNQRSDAERWHSTLSKIAPDSGEIELAQPCLSGERNVERWLIGVWLDPQLTKGLTPERLYFSIRKEIGAFYVDAIAANRPEGCPGTTRPVLRDFTLPMW